MMTNTQVSKCSDSFAAMMHSDMDTLTALQRITDYLRLLREDVALPEFDYEAFERVKPQDYKPEEQWN
jgi:hypothetical protein